MPNDPTGRALQLLSVLQTHRFWRATELAARLEVTPRTVRRDVDRLRELGYQVDATSGRHGGYRLRAGSHLPPLILDDDEAVAVAIGLRQAAAAAIDGIEETSVRALAKIELLLPARLRRRVSALQTSVSTVRTAGDDLIDPESLSVLAAACRDHEHVRFDYPGSGGEQRRVRPHHLVATGRRWYLVAWDEQRADWRTFRLDRICRTRAVGSRFVPAAIPGGDAADFVARAVAPARAVEAVLELRASADDLADVLRWVDHTVLKKAPDRCRLLIRGEDLGRLAMAVARLALSAPLTVTEPAALVDVVGRLTAHLGGNPGDDWVELQRGR